MDGAKQQFVGVGRYQLTCLKNLLVIIINLSILHRSIPTHSLPMVLMNDDAKRSAADSLEPKLVTIDPMDSANSS